MGGRGAWAQNSSDYSSDYFQLSTYSFQTNGKVKSFMIKINAFCKKYKNKSALYKMKIKKPRRAQSMTERDAIFFILKSYF
jgi:hypothetical protein